MAVRLKDVAEEAEVSVKTVSNVVNGFARVSPATRERVQRAIDTLGYTPNLSARQLRSGRTAIVALGVPELRQPYFAEVTAETMAQAKKAGLTLIVEETRGDPVTELAVVRGLDSSLISGVILSPLALSERQLARRPGRVPVVLLGERQDLRTCDHVLVDNLAAARDMTEHLLALGRTRIAVIGAQARPPSATSTLRLQGCRDLLAQAGLTMPAEYCRPTGPYSRQAGAESMSRLLELPEPPDAVFCFSDLLAIGALRVAHDRGVRVPEEVVIAGFDDIEESRYCVPSLTTISPDKVELGRLAISLLQERMTPERQPRPPVTAYVGYRLVVRESTAGSQTTPLLDSVPHPARRS